MKTLVTGANGFVGQALCQDMQHRRLPVVGAVRAAQAETATGAPCVHVGNIDGQTEWGEALEGIDAVVHLAARVHVMNDTAPDPAALFRQVNVEGTVRLAQACARHGVQRFVFVSSIKVNGEETLLAPYTELSDVHPEGDYARSKWEAEQALRQLERETGLDVVILRIPLVYGPGVKGNFFSLLQAVDAGRILPFGSIRNQRSMVGLSNLIDVLIRCVEHPAAKGQTFLVSDNDDVSTPELIRRIAAALERSPRLIPVPLFLLRAGTTLIGRRDAMRKIESSLQIDPHTIRKTLEWSPPVTMDCELRKTAAWLHASPSER